MNVSNFKTGERRDHLLDALRMAGVTASCPVYVPGEDAMPLLLWLCTRGFGHVIHVPSHAHPAIGPDGVVIVPRTVAPEALEGALAGCRHMAPGALLVVQTAAARRPEQRRALGDALEWAGLRVQASIPASTAREIHVARRVAPDLKKAA